jgi:type VI secretion system protein ImpL
MPSFSNPFVLTGIAVVVVAAAVAIFLWLKSAKAARDAKAAESAQAQSPQAGAPAAGGGQDPIHGLFLEAANRLKLSPTMRGATLQSLPAILVLGPEKAGKTSLMLHSGIEPELLAGHVFQGSEVIPTKAPNIWLARGALWIEVPAAMAANAAALASIAGHITPGRFSQAFGARTAPRAILLALPKDIPAAAETPDDVAAAARPWNQCLGHIAAAMGAQLPVYILFTMSDGLSGFSEFAFNLGPTELGQSIGATIRPFNPASGGVYAEETSRLINDHFSQIAFSLFDARVPLLSREHERMRAVQHYQFAREFQKLQKQAVQFLVELGKPSQLQVSAFLRGFYFSGVRKVMVESRASAESGSFAVEPVSAPLGATRMLSAEEMRQMAAGGASAAPTQREVSEWLFTTAVFEGVLLRDSAAQSVSASSSGADRARALLYSIALLLGLFFFVAFCISYVRNRSLERDLSSGAALLADKDNKQPILQRLDVMRHPVQRLLEYRAGSPPLSMRWTLYQGAVLMPPAQASYCAAIRDQVLEPVARRMTERLAAMPKAAGDHSGDFSLLKAFMMMTTHPEKADETFLADEITGYWRDSSTTPPAPAAEQLSSAQFRTYGALLPIPEARSACVFQAPPNVIPDAQAFLRSLNLNDRYRSLLDQAGRGIEGVDYNKRFPNPPNIAVSDPKFVPGYFTKQGWVRMQELLNHPETSLKADAWVLGETNELSTDELMKMASDFRTRYQNDYAQAWRDYLAGARVANYANLEDAANKLERMSGPRSVLLNLIAIASEHTAGIDPMKPLFQPAKAAVPSAEDFSPAADYLAKLDALKNHLLKAAGSTGPAHDQDAQEVRNAAFDAKGSVDGIARNFKGEADEAVKRILTEPIRQIDPLLNRQNADAVNGAGTDLCHSVARLSRMLPFALGEQSARIDEIQKLLAPDTGDAAQFYKNFLADSVDCLDTQCFLKAQHKLQITPAFLHFFSALVNWRTIIYSPRGIRLNIRVLQNPDSTLRQMDVSIDGQKLSLTSGGGAETIVWDPFHSSQLEVTGQFQDVPDKRPLASATGPWSIFVWLLDTEPGPGMTILPRQGRNVAMRLPNGHDMKYHLDVRWSDNRPFDKAALQFGGCPAVVAPK